MLSVFQFFFKKVVFCSFFVVGLVFGSPDRGYSQEFRTDALYLQRLQSAQIRAQIKQEQERRRRQHVAGDAQAFLNNRQAVRDRVRFGQVNQEVVSREAEQRRAQVWNQYLVQKAAEEERLERGDPAKQPRHLILAQQHRDFARKKAAHNRLLNRQISARQGFLAEERAKKKSQFEIFQEQQDRFNKRLEAERSGEIVFNQRFSKAPRYRNFLTKHQKLRGSVVGLNDNKEQRLRRTFSAKAMDFRDFVTRQNTNLSKVEDATTESGRRMQAYSQKAGEFRDFVNKQNSDRKKAKLIADDPDAFQNKQFGAKAKEFQDFIAKKQEEQRILRSAGTEESRLQRSFSEKQGEYRDFIALQQKNRQVAQLNQLPPVEAFRRELSAKTQEFQDYLAERRRLDKNKTGAGLSKEEAQRADFRARRGEFAEFVERRRQLDSNKASGALNEKEAFEEFFKSKQGEFQEFVARRGDLDQLKGGRGQTAEEFRQVQFNVRKDEFKEFVDRRNELDKQNKTAGGVDAKEFQQRIFEANRQVYQDFVDRRNQLDRDNKTFGGLDAADAQRREFRGKSDEFQQFVERQQELDRFKQTTFFGNGSQPNNSQAQAFENFVNLAQNALDQAAQQPPE